MKRIFCLSGIIWGLVACQTASAAACGTVSGNLVANCGFETGSFQSWTLGGQLTGGLNGNYYGVQTSPVNSGKYSAYFGTNVTTVLASTTLSQQLTAPGSSNYQVSFYIDQDAGVSGSAANPIALSVSFGSSLVSSVVNAPATNGFVFETFLVHDFTDVNPVLKFSFLNTPDYYFLDDVSVVRLGAITPEAGSFLLSICGIAGLALVRKIRRTR